MSLSFLQRIRYAPWFTQLVVIRKCNLSCKYCNEFDSSSDPIPFSTLRARAEKLKELGAFSINLTGGEPTMHPDLPELIRYCRHDLKFLRTSMISNGFYLKPELIKTLNEAGLQDMQISIDGVKPNEVTVKVLDSLRKRLAYLKEYAKFNVVVSGVIGSCPPEETFEVIRYAKEMNFKPRVLLLHGEDGQVKLNAEEMAVFERIKKMIPRSFPEFTDYRYAMIKNGEAPFKCRAGSRYLYVDENGVVTWCSQTRDAFRKNLMDYSYEDLKREFYTYKSCQDKCTLGCVRAASSVDNWRRQEGPELKVQTSVYKPNSSILS
ncbi:MAG TPA: radical SAM protein [Deltaproteobacteria bacterium]|nr:radical SAM protein [Deltaproteobacteria bacterium]